MIAAGATVMAPPTAQAIGPLQTLPTPTGTANPTYVYLKLAGPGLCLVRVGTVVELGNCTNSSDRRWTWDQASPNRFLLNGASAACLKPTTVTHGAPVTTASCTSDSSVQWKTTHLGNNEYKIEQHNTANRCLDTSFAQTAAGTDAVIGACTGSATQKWTITLV